MSDYHHTVTEKATPNVEFTKWCYLNDNLRMDLNALRHIRLDNLRRLIDREFGGNQSAFARCYGRKSSYVNDLLREGGKKSFGEKAVRRAEEKTGLMAGQLDIPNSPLRMSERQKDSVDDELRIEIGALDPEEKRALLDTVRKIRLQRGRRRKAG